MPFFLILVIAISLSMDAFSLSLAYGTLRLKKRDIISLTIIVGIYHFVMPLFGYLLGSSIFYYIKINPDLIICIILGIIGFGMIGDTFHEDEKMKKMKFLELLFFGLAVSMDSFSLGIGLNAITEHIFLCAIIFSLVSAMFTYFGLFLGKKISHMIGKFATFIGGIILILIGIFAFVL